MAWFGLGGSTTGSSVPIMPAPMGPVPLGPGPAPSAPAPTALTEAPTTTQAPEPPPEAPQPTTARTEATRRPTTTEARSTGTTPSAASGSSGFWYRLRLCESEDGATSSNLYQLMGGTDVKMGIDGSEPEWEQTAAAQRWAALIHPNEGTSAGWPVCWWVALRAG